MKPSSKVNFRYRTKALKSPLKLPRIKLTMVASSPPSKVKRNSFDTAISPTWHVPSLKTLHVASATDGVPRLTCAAIVVNIKRQGVHDVAQPLGKDGVGHRFPERETKDVQEGGQGVLVHGIDQGHFGQHEKQNGPSLGRRAVAISQFVDVDGCFLSQLEFVRDLGCTRK